MHMQELRIRSIKVDTATPPSASAISAAVVAAEGMVAWRGLGIVT